MDLVLEDEHLAIQTLAHDFALEHLAPFAKKWDEESFFPVDTFRQAATLGFGGIYIKEDVGGSNLSRLAATIIFEELAMSCIPSAAYLSIHNMVCSVIDRYGNAAQRQHFLPKLITMEHLSSYCLTEPEAGSDAAALQSTAIDKGDYYLVNGTKAFISGGSVSDLYLCMLRTADTRAQGISCFLIPKDTPGLSFGQKEKKLGWRSQPTTMVFFSNCEVPKENLIGIEGQGFKIALNALNGGRINIGACSVGGAKACFNYAKQYMSERKQFGKKLAEMDPLRNKMAEMFSDLTTARLHVHHAARALDNNDKNTALYCAMAKRIATDAGFRISDNALQIFGGYGYLHDYPIERYFRDLRVHQILEGTNEIMLNVMAKEIFK